MIKRMLAPISRLGLLATFILLVGLTSGQAQPTEAENNKPSGQVIIIDPNPPKGKLKKLENDGRKDVNQFDYVQRSDVLYLSPPAKAQVKCLNRLDAQPIRLVSGVNECPCKIPCQGDACGLNYNGNKIKLPRGGYAPNSPFPLVLSPRKTLLSNTRPKIRWTPVAGAKGGATYKVILYEEGWQVVWSKDGVSNTELAYPPDEPPLTPGQTYKVVVSMGDASSEQELLTDLGFTVLSAGERRALTAQERKIRLLRLPAPQTRFLLASLHVARGLYAEAIGEFEALSKSLKEPALMRTLGDLYLALDLNREAERWYIEALALQVSSSLGEQALTQRGLAQVYENLGNLEWAVAKLGEAKEAYKKLGDAAMVASLETQERRLKLKLPAQAADR